MLAGDVTTVAPLLLGATVRVQSDAGPVAVRLTEVEAYDGAHDPGSHAYRGRTVRTATMFGPPGHLYVYFTYGMHWCANVVTGPPGAASAVLMRAGEVIEGLPLARRRRPAARRDVDLARGPARLAACLGLTGEHDGVGLLGPAPGESGAAGVPGASHLVMGAVALHLPARGVPGSQMRIGPRVGVSGPGGDGDRFPWRYWVAHEQTVSAYRPAKLRGCAPS